MGAVPSSSRLTALSIGIASVLFSQMASADNAETMPSTTL